MAADSPELVDAYRSWSARSGFGGTEVRGWTAAVLLGGMAWWIAGPYGLLALLVLGLVWALGLGDLPDVPLDDVEPGTEAPAQRSRDLPDDDPWTEDWLWLGGPLRF